ncbi:MAG: sialate O-acetylesterase [Victivallales bacterium]|jgi:sialate O-acetylesterase|nr:sialate O-acetylesterase [Victivallales bacterium]
MQRLVKLLAVLALLSTARADVTMPALFADHMVLQREMKLPVWGWAEPGEKVTVAFAGQTAAATADAKGDWKVVLKPVTGTDPLTMTVTGKNTVAIKDILMGEVWICSGQSNMNFRVGRCQNLAQEKAAANFPKLRHYQIRNTVCPEPNRKLAGNWTICSPDTVAGYTGTGYFFGRELHTQLGVPVGLVHTSWGGTPAEAWTSREDLEANPDLKPILDRFAVDLEKYPERKVKHDAAVAAWRVKAKAIRAAGKKPGRAPRPPKSRTHYQSPCGLYNGMILSVAPFAARGAIWYQGESNAGRGEQYRILLPAMIQNWRRIWGQDSMSFGIVQLANFRAAQTDPDEKSAWAELRESQTWTAKNVPDCGMAVIIDVGMAKDIHPVNKQDVGKRLALWALATDYGKDIVYSGPDYKAMKKEGKTIRLSFDHVGGGLVAKGNALKGFTIAGADKKFVWADAKIVGNEIVLQAEAVADPVAVRYGWANNPPCSLYNQEGLPAVPFRTDDWPGVTDGKR